MTLPQVTEFFGWCIILNFIFLFVAGILIVYFTDWLTVLHKKLFKIPAASLSKIYFKYIAYYKILFVFFNLVPWIVLKIMT